MNHRQLFNLIVISCLAFVLSSCAAFRGTERSISHIVVPGSTEAEIGNQYHDQISQEFQLIDDPEAQAWVDQMGARLVANSPECSQTFNFYITAAPEVNAFAIPGGHCYLNLGLIAFADNEAQVAAVMGHEVNHVTMRHGVLQLQRAAGLEMVLVTGSQLIGNSAVRGAAILAGQGGTYLASQKFGRDDEREADKYGVRAMYGAGYDPRESFKFFSKLNAYYEGQTPSWLESIVSTHPPTNERVENLQEQIQKEGYNIDQNLIVNTPEFEAIKARLVSMYGAAE